MAVVNSVSAQGAQRIDQIRYPVVDNSEIMEIRGEIVEETSPREVEDKIYVAVGKDLKESQSILRWALHNSGGRQICILHVHQPAEKIPIMGTKFRINQLEAHQVKTFHDEERQTMHQLIDKYKQICREVGVSVEVQHIEMESIEKGIVELLLQHNVRRLVMGAAADNKYSKRMVDLKSKKAIYVRLHAAASCQIQFICKGKIIFTRQSRLDGLGASISSPSLLPDTNSDSEQSSLRSKSVGGAQNTRLRLNSLTPEYHRGMSDNRGIRRPVITLPNDNLESTPVSRLNAGRASDEWSVISQRSPSIGSRLSTCSSDLVDDSALIPYATIGSGEIRSDYSAVPGFLEDIHRPSPPSVLQEGGMNDELYDQLERAMAEAGNSRRDAFEESIRRRKAEKDAMEAKRRVKRSESLYANELRQRREIDEELEKTKEEHEDIKKELDEVAEELRMALEQKSFLESQVADFDQTIQELEQKMFSAVELLQNYKKERDELQVECDDALRSLEELREKQAEESSSSSTSRLYTEFSFSEIKDATCNFDPSLKIGEGGYGSIFRGFLRHTDVAIKMLNSHSLQGSSEFHQEVDVLSKLRHPNLVTLIGACPDAWIIVYEYLSGGSLEDRLNCKDNTPPLSWQNRIRIAAELCSVLIFLHSCDIVHGDLKPANLLLDKNLVSKLSDFGICRVLSQTEFSSNYTSLCCRTSPKGTFVYMDPEFISTGELTSKSDTYSFGIILLRLLTDWPFVQAQQLALLAMNCCDVVRENRPDLASEVWKVLEPMRVSCGLSSFRFGAEGRCQIPHYFNCPIFQEMMQDPVVAADGYTYEAEALRGWLDSGHNTSPMTNLELANSNLVPNRALKSAIQEWLQQS
ncbi:U-box domain-containing protein 33-like isoform X4 [Cynara cardunculus var. scolymus]|uniref:U-box domain-containing protein 33-like isoform X4 n=1 Tax=Cynara cardunculus var. scolymus TaxID=59895 RepID=UPI000D62A797|nr:U-box domain-containing protein 33-like isoform X4 [Cynara cardunculus var. scolymus]